MRFTLPIATVLAISLASTTQASKPVVAVFEIKNSANVSSEDLLTLYGLIGTELAATGQFSVVPNSDIKRALRDKKAESYNDCYDESCQIEIGKELAAEMTLATSIKKLGRYCIVSMQLYNLRTGASDRGATQKSSCQSDELLEALIRGIGQLTESGRAKTQTKASNAPDRDIGTSEKKWVPSISKEVIASFSSEPPGAVVLLNGRMLCQATPCTKNAPAGTHEVTIEKEEYFSRVERTLIGKGSKIAWKLKPRFGTVNITTTPEGLEVKVNKSTVGRTPIENFRLSPGRYEITVNDSCYYTQGKDIRIKAGEERTLVLDMQPQRGALHVRATNEASEAIEADIMIDGERAGTTPSTLMVSVCAKTVTVTHPEHGKWSKPINVKTKETRQVTAKLDAWLGDGRFKTLLPRAQLLQLAASGCAHISPAHRVMLDSKTGLMWQVKPGKTIAYSPRRIFNRTPHAREASEYCAKVRSGGFSDWRVPSRTELITAARARDFSLFTNQKSDRDYIAVSTDAECYYHVDIYEGATVKRVTDVFRGGYDVRCVRGQTKSADINEYFLKAKRAVISGRDWDARGSLVSCLELNPTHSECNKLSGTVRERLHQRSPNQGHIEEAIKNYRRYLAVTPNAADREAIREKISTLTRQQSKVRTPCVRF